MFKSIAFAYPSSIHAKQFKSADGCYLVKTREGVEAGNVTGPYETVEDAERAAEALTGEWCPMYRNRPLPGSQFA